MWKQGVARRRAAWVWSGQTRQVESRPEEQLFEAARTGDLAALRTVLVYDRHLVHARGALGWTPMHVAAHAGQAAAVEALLAFGAPLVDREDGDRATPLHLAAGAGRLDVVRLLVRRGAPVDDRGDVHRAGPLGWATLYGQAHLRVADFLAESGAEVDLFVAVALGRTHRVQTLLAADPAAAHQRMGPCDDGKQPLHLALLKGRRELAALLLQAGADPNARTHSGVSGLDLMRGGLSRRLDDLRTASALGVDLCEDVPLRAVDQVGPLMSLSPSVLGPEVRRLFTARSRPRCGLHA